MVLDRLAFLMEATGEGPIDAAVARAVTCWDRAVCAVAEGARIIIHGRDGSRERLEP